MLRRYIKTLYPYTPCTLRTSCSKSELTILKMHKLISPMITFLIKSVLLLCAFFFLYSALVGWQFLSLSTTFPSPHLSSPPSLPSSPSPPPSIPTSLTFPGTVCSPVMCIPFPYSAPIVWQFLHLPLLPPHPVTPLSSTSLTFPDKVCSPAVCILFPYSAPTGWQFESPLPCPAMHPLSSVVCVLFLYSASWMTVSISHSLSLSLSSSPLPIKSVLQLCVLFPYTAPVMW